MAYISRSIMYSHIYDAQQVKLPVRKDPERPAWNFPRDYGINAKRKLWVSLFIIWRKLSDLLHFTPVFQLPQMFAAI